jgi:hypothetical protein
VMMGVDLTILPESWRSAGGHILAYNALHLDRNNDLFRAIGDAGIEVDVDRPVTCHFARNKDGDTCFGEVDKNPYGGKLTTVKAYDLHRVMSAFAMTGNNMWIFAAVGAMPHNMSIVMYWH